jgi:pimeloyl-ACP methyl ester carboxylesterase
MKTINFFSILALLAFIFQPSLTKAQSAESLAGHWEGAFVRLGSVQTLSVDLMFSNGTLKGTYDIPDLSIIGEPLSEITFQSSQLLLKLKYGVFTMQVASDVGEMTGENKKWNPTVTLHLKRKLRDSSLPYIQEEVKFKNGNVTLSGTLVKPLTAAPYPVVVVVHGSGEQGRNFNFYKFWGDFFARHGVAALIYDKRGVGQSSGDFRTATFDDLAGDVVAAVKTLKKRKDINLQQIGIFGISQGGWIGPLAASLTRDIKFLILDVGPAVTVEEQELNSVEYSMRADEIPETDIKEALAYTRLMFKAAYTGEAKPELAAATQRIRNKEWSKYVQLVDSDKDLEDWKRIKYDPAPVLRKTKIPVLSLFGENDVRVPPVENRKKMENYLKEAGNNDVTIRVIPNVGHDMESFATLRGGEWKWSENYWVWAKKSPVFYETIIEWLTKHGIKAI